MGGVGQFIRKRSGPGERSRLQDNNCAQGQGPMSSIIIQQSLVGLKETFLIWTRERAILRLP